MFDWASPSLYVRVSFSLLCMYHFFITSFLTPVNGTLKMFYFICAVDISHYGEWNYLVSLLNTTPCMTVVV